MAESSSQMKVIENCRVTPATPVPNSPDIMAESSSQMKVIEICRVTPAAPVPNSPDTTTPTMLPLTFFDLQWLRFAPAQCLFLYHLSPSESLVFFDSILPKLKLSLSLTLRRYLPLSGKITWRQDFEKPVMLYEEGDSVSLTVAQSESDFRRFSELELCEATECYFMIPDLEDSDEEIPVMALQVTHFPNSGFCIGFTNHHAAIDGKSSVSFMKAWAYICKIGEGTSLPAELNPFYDRTMIGDPIGLEEIYVNVWLNQNGPNNKSVKYKRLEVPPNLTRGIFEISREKIEKLKTLIAAKLHQEDEEDEGENNTVRVTMFTVTCAYTWVCIVKAEQTQDSSFICSVDCRPRLNPPVPPSYLGNCVIGRFVKAKTEDLLDENGVAMAVKSISKTIETLSEENRLFEDAKGWASKLSTIGTRSGRVIAAAGSPRFEVYSTDFGWGSPRKVELTSIDKTRSICISESRNGDGGIQVGLVLNTAAMPAFATLFRQGLEAI